MAIENVILSNLVFNEEYSRKVLPFLKTEYFSDFTQRTLYELASKYISKYNRLPTKSSLIIDLENLKDIDEKNFISCKTAIDAIDPPEEKNLSWLIEHTEKFCQDRAIYNAIMESIKIIDDSSEKRSKGSIPELLSNALSVSFDNNIGHDYFDDYNSRFESYNKFVKKIPFDLDYFNAITDGGLEGKTLSIAMAGTGVGKSMFMCHCAAANLRNGYNVLYITMEMSEEKVAKRIDANLFDTNIGDLKFLPKDVTEKKIDKLKSKVKGKLIIKEYPTTTGSAANFRHLLNELRIKKNFVPDIVYVDYLNICASSRLKQGANVNSYTYIKAIAEEIRGLAMEFNIPIVSATQTTRSGFRSSDVELTDTSESFGLPMTADLMFALISTEELQELNQIMVKQLKNRDNDISAQRRFVVGVDRAKMKLYNVEQSAQEDIMETPEEPSNNFRFSRR